MALLSTERAEDCGVVGVVVWMELRVGVTVTVLRSVVLGASSCDVTTTVTVPGLTVSATVESPGRPLMNNHARTAMIASARRTINPMRSPLGWFFPEGVVGCGRASWGLSHGFCIPGV